MIDQTKLQNVERKDGKITARCPACAAKNGDHKGEHLVVFDDGRFACVANPNDKKHRQEIWKAVGSKDKLVKACAPLEIISASTPRAKVLLIIEDFSSREEVRAEKESELSEN